MGDRKPDLTPGDKLWNGATVTSYHHREEATRGSLQNGVALCYYRGEWVVWTQVSWDPSFPFEGKGSWQATGGHYFDQQIDASRYYQQYVDDV